MGDTPDLVAAGLANMFEGGRLLGRFAREVAQDREEGAGPGECRTASLLDVVEPDAELATGLDPHPVNITQRYYNLKVISYSRS